METVVGIGTLALAGATFWLALAASRTLKLQREEAVRSRRPVIVPASDRQQVSFRNGAMRAGPPLKTGQPGVEELAIPLQNIGTGPALNVRGIVAIGGAASIHCTGRTLHPIEGIAAGAANAAVFTQDRDGTLDIETELWGRLVYEDVSGNSYRTDLQYNETYKRYRARVDGPDDYEPPSHFPDRRRVEDVLPRESFAGRYPAPFWTLPRRDRTRT
ncbi:MAG: hypothetical protein ACJ768_14485 [Gaiellaceae bacterium]